MRCVLHIGSIKTGTSLLQDWLYANRPQLSIQGVYLSDLLGKPNNRLFPAYFRQDLDDWAKRNKVSTVEEKEAFFEHFEVDLSREIKAAGKDHEVFIISSEHIHDRVRNLDEIENIRSFLAAHFSSVDVICYFRDPYSQAVSLYSTALRNGTTHSLNDFISMSATRDAYLYDWEIAGRLWAGVFGDHHCNFRLYSRQKFKQADIRLDFVEALGIPIDLSPLDFSTAAKNERLSSIEGAAILQVNKFFPYWEAEGGGISRFNITLQTVISALESLKCGDISTEEPPAFAKFRESNQAFLNQYVAGSQEVPEPDLPDGSEQNFSVQEVQEMISNVLAATFQAMSQELHRERR